MPEEKVTEEKDSVTADVQETQPSTVTTVDLYNGDDVPILPVDDLLTTDPLQLTKAEAAMVGSISNAKSKQG